MKREIARQVYAYTVCAITLVVAIMFFATGVYGIVKIVAPEFTVSQREWNSIATFQSFKTEWEMKEGAPELSDEELRFRWQDKREVAIQGERREGGQNLVNMIIAVIVLTPLFLIHWFLARRMRVEHDDQ